MSAAIENAVLSTFVVGTAVLGTHKNEDFFPLDPSVFTGQFRRRLAEAANKAIHENRPLSELFFEIGEKLANSHPNHQDAWLDILATNPLPVEDAKYYHRKLKEIQIRRRIQCQAA